MIREQVYGRRAVREALRGHREVLELWVTERALGAEGWLRDVPGLRVQIKPDRALNGAAGTPDHQGVLAWCTVYPYADAYELAVEPSPLRARFTPTQMHTNWPLSRARCSSASTR